MLAGLVGYLDLKAGLWGVLYGSEGTFSCDKNVYIEIPWKTEVHKTNEESKLTYHNFQSKQVSKHQQAMISSKKEEQTNKNCQSA